MGQVLNPRISEVLGNERRPMRIGEVSVATYHRTFNVLGKDSRRGKPLVGCQGEKMYAEVAIVTLLRAKEFHAVWVDTYGHGNQAKFWKSMSEEDTLPERVRDIYDKIVQSNCGRIGGCWDVWVWDDPADTLAFIELKQNTASCKDSINSNQVSWLTSALKAEIPGVTQSCFVICEWGTLSATERRKAFRFMDDLRD